MTRKPIWGPCDDPINPGLTVAAYYDSNEYEVQASYKGRILSSKLPAMYIPHFGVDVADVARIGELAEKLADDLIATQE